MVRNVTGFLGYAVTHRAGLFALATLVSLALGHFGIHVPHIPSEVTTAILTLLTGYFGITTDEAAFLDGFLTALEGQDGDGDNAPATGPPTA